MYRQRPNYSQRGSYGRSNRGYSNPGIRINPALFVRKAEPVAAVDTFVPSHAFADFPIDVRLKQNITAKGYVSPTPIQDKAIPYLLEGRDVIGIANTGTGKTAAFLIPLFQKVLVNPNEKVLIIAPTRELAVQIYDECISFARGLNIFAALCIGGASLKRQMFDLRRRPQFVIGTPGRLKDLEKQRALYFDSYTSIVLDEVDRMLDMGFIKDIKEIIIKLPSVRHSLFFSATIPESVKEIMNRFLRNPVTISVKTQESSNNVDQDVIRMQGRHKLDVLHDLLVQDGFEKVLVFGRTKHGAEKLAKSLDERGFKVAAIHGNKNQNQRQRALELFKKNKVQVLLATDIASRGLDIDDVTHVINYDLPESYEDYVHRIGRTGRANKKGTALTFLD